MKQISEKLPLLILAFVVLNTAAENEVKSPESINVSVGEIALFTCEFNFSLNYAAWFLNDTFLHYYTDLYFDEHLYLERQPITSTLKILVSTEHKTVLNNTIVSCQAINTIDQFSKWGLPAHLRVQDVLEAPSFVEAVFTNNGIAIQWTRPYTLHGINITGYLITTHVIGRVSNSTGFAVIHPDNNSCNNYQICIQAQTAAGLGDEGCINKSRMGILGSLHDRTVLASVFNHPSTTTEHHYMISAAACPADQGLEQNTLKFPKEGMYHVANESSFGSISHSNISLILDLAVPTTAKDEYITMEVSTENISSHVEGLLIDPTETGYLFLCDFAMHSTAVECFVEFVCVEDTKTSLQLNISRETGLHMTSSDISCSRVTIYIFDVNDGVVNDVHSLVHENIHLEFPLLPSTFPTAITSSQVMPSSTSPSNPSETNLTSSESSAELLFAIIILSINGLIVTSVSLCMCFACTFICCRLSYHKKKDLTKKRHRSRVVMYIPKHYPPEMDDMFEVELQHYKKEELIIFPKGPQISSPSSWEKGELYSLTAV